MTDKDLLSQKDLLELKYWITQDMTVERANQHRYAADLTLLEDDLGSVLEIGTGPHFGILPLVKATRKVGVDPLYRAYWKLGLLDAWEDIIRIEEPFETWDASEKFDAIVSINSLDHGWMGFQLLPKISGLLNPGGYFYLCVHLRPTELLNLIHDHSLTVDDYERSLGMTNLFQVTREVREADPTGWECPTLISICQKPLQ